MIIRLLFEAEQDVDDQELLSEQEKMIRNLQMKVQNFKIESDIARVQYVCLLLYIRYTYLPCVLLCAHIDSYLSLIMHYQTVYAMIEFRIKLYIE